MGCAPSFEFLDINFSLVLAKLRRESRCVLQLYLNCSYIARSHKKPGQGRAFYAHGRCVDEIKLLSLLARLLVALLPTLARFLCLLARFLLGPTLLATLLTVLVLLAALVRIVR